MNNIFPRKSTLFDHDLILFTVATESLSRIEADKITIIGGRSASGLAVTGKRLIDVIDLHVGELGLLTVSFYKIREKVAIIPLGNKVLAIYNRLLRSNGLGVAFIFDYSPGCISAILSERSFESIIFSDSFKNFSAKSKGAMELLSSLSYAVEALESVAFPAFENLVSDAKTILDSINLLSDIMGCPTSSRVMALPSGELTLDRPTLTVFLLCLLSTARRLSRDRRADISLLLEGSFKISVDFSISPKNDIQSQLSEADFCDRMAEEMGIPFSFISDGELCRGTFVPFRKDPSLMGFKAGIFIDGRRFIRRT